MLPLVMRIAELQIRNFRGYRDATVRLEQLTVLTGPNDGGKSTLVDAIRSLFTDTDRFGRVMSWNGVRSMGSTLDESDVFETVAAQMRGDPPAGEASYVLALMSSDEHDATGWQLLSKNPRFGAYWRPGAETPDRCVVVKDDEFRAAFGDPADWREWLAETQIAHDANGIWLHFEEARLALSPILESDLWPPLEANSLVHVPGPDTSPISVGEVLRPLVVRSVFGAFASSDRDAIAIALSKPTCSRARLQ
jgi:hypothetical protein